MSNEIKIGVMKFAHGKEDFNHLAALTKTLRRLNIPKFKLFLAEAGHIMHINTDH